MSRFLIAAVLVLGIIAAITSLFVFGLERSQEGRPIHDAPWDITVKENGTIQVMGIVIGADTVQRANQSFGKKPRVSLFQSETTGWSLEASYGEVVAGGMGGSAIANIAVDSGWADGARERAGKAYRIPGGMIQVALTDADVAAAETFMVEGLTFIPENDLSDQVIAARFGKPSSVVKLDPKAFQWYFPDKGVFVTQGVPGKEVIQYLPLTRFEAVTAPMREGKETVAR
ncbi:MAG: hypothetical protein HQK87_06765 [Nitrospinae bacterium]|nr:hypothetical protein [Nitrospinota bacterium]